MVRRRRSRLKFLFLLGFQFKVTLASAMPIGKQTRGTFKIKFHEKDEEVLLFE